MGKSYCLDLAMLAEEVTAPQLLVTIFSAGDYHHLRSVRCVCLSSSNLSCQNELGYKTFSFFF